MKCCSILYHYNSAFMFSLTSIFTKPHLLYYKCLWMCLFVSVNGSICQLNKVRGIAQLGCTAAVCCSPPSSGTSVLGDNRNFGDSLPLLQYLL